MPSEHLHMIREKDPRPLASKAHKPFLVHCQYCNEGIWVIHTELPPENPKETP